MTNLEAINILKTWRVTGNKEHEAFDMATSALQAQEAKVQLSAEGTTSDCISRQAAIKCLEHLSACDEPFVEIGTGDETFIGKYEAITEISDLPSAQPELNFDEWCTDCKEYDHEKHCCPRFNRVIRQALKDAQPEIIRCKDCKYRGGLSGFYCDIVEKAVGVDSFCSWAERRTDA